MGSVDRYTQWRCWLRHFATSRKEFFTDKILPALWLTQPLTEMSTRNISWGVKAAGTSGWQPYHFHVPTGLKSGSFHLLHPSGPVQVCNWIALPLDRYSIRVSEDSSSCVYYQTARDHIPEDCNWCTPLDNLISYRTPCIKLQRPAHHNCLTLSDDSLRLATREFTCYEIFGTFAMLLSPNVRFVNTLHIHNNHFD